MDKFWGSGLEDLVILQRCSSIPRKSIVLTLVRKVDVALIFPFATIANLDLKATSDNIRCSPPALHVHSDRHGTMRRWHLTEAFFEDSLAKEVDHQAADLVLLHCFEHTRMPLQKHGTDLEFDRRLFSAKDLQALPHGQIDPVVVKVLHHLGNLHCFLRCVLLENYHAFAAVVAHLVAELGVECLTEVIQLKLSSALVDVLAVVEDRVETEQVLVLPNASALLIIHDKVVVPLPVAIRVV